MPGVEPDRRVSLRATYFRGLVGVVAGLAVGFVISVLVVVTKLPFLVNTPRSEHGLLLVALFAIPAVAGGVIGLLMPRGLIGRR